MILAWIGLLLGFLPIVQMRRSLEPALGPGCGQLIIAPARRL